MEDPKQEMTKVSDDDYNLIFEQEFITFNKIRTVMCRNLPCMRGKKCTFAHKANEIRRSICMYHFNNGCTKAASVCIHSHEDKDLEKSIIDYKIWKNPSPKTQSKKVSEQELIAEFGEFKISLDDDEDDIEYEDETDEKLVKMVNESAKTPYVVNQVDDTSFNIPEHLKNRSSIDTLVPLNEWEKSNQTDIYQIVFNQQIIITNMINKIQALEMEVNKLKNKNE